MLLQLLLLCHLMFGIASVNNYLIICSLLFFFNFITFWLSNNIEKTYILDNGLFSVFWMLILWFRMNPFSTPTLLPPELSYHFIWQNSVSPDSHALPMGAHQLYCVWTSSELRRVLFVSCFSEMQFVALTFEKILWWYFVKIQMKHKRYSPEACKAGQWQGEQCLPASLAQISPHARESHQNDKREALNHKGEAEYQLTWRTFSHYSEAGKAALGGEKPWTSLRTQITMESKLLSIRQEGLWLTTSGNSYQHTIFLQSSACPLLPCSGIGRMTAEHHASPWGPADCRGFHLIAPVLWFCLTPTKTSTYTVWETKLIYRKCMWYKGGK